MLKKMIDGLEPRRLLSGTDVVSVVDPLNICGDSSVPNVPPLVMTLDPVSGNAVCGIKPDSMGIVTLDDSGSDTDGNAAVDSTDSDCGISDPTADPADVLIVDMGDSTGSDNSTGDTSSTTDDSWIYETMSGDVQPIRYSLGGPKANQRGNHSAAPTTGTLQKGRTVTSIGTSAADTITVTSPDGSTIDVSLNGVVTSYDAKSVRNVNLQGLGGDDTLSVDLPASMAKKVRVELHGGTGNDTLASDTRARIVGDAGNDTLTSTATTPSTLIGGTGNDTLRSSTTRDVIRAGSGQNQVFFADGSQTIGDLKLVNRKGRFTVSGSKTAPNDFKFSQTSSGKIKIALGNQFTTVAPASIKSITLVGGQKKDSLSLPANLLGNKPFSKRSIELT